MNYATFACERLVWGRAMASRVVLSNVSKLLRILSAAIAVFLICAPLFSQGSQGTIQGGVFDQSGGAIAGAMVTVTDVARGVSRTLVADAAGQYTATSLNPGTYTIRAESKGFKNAQHAGVLLEVGQTIRVDMTLQPGEQSQTVTVTGEVPAVNTSDATLGGTVSNESINALPLNGRNFERLLQLRPGVVVGVGAGTGSASTNGMRTGEDLTLIEGLSQMSPSTGASVLNASYRTGDSSSLLPIDAIQEFNTEQNPKAEYGWKAGSVIDVGVKSGTNSIHGAAWAFGRDASATDASNYFSTPGTPGVTPATLEQFGATAGGRIIKDKLFWFLGYEGLRTTLGDVTQVTIPSDCSTPACTDTTVAANIANNMIAACTLQKAQPAGVNALSAQLAGLGNFSQGSAGNCTVTPASSSFENLFPYITSPSTSFSPPLVTTGPLNNGFVKIDYIVGQHSHVSGMYYVSKTTQTVAYATGSIDGQLTPQWEASVPADAEMYNGAWTWTPTSTWVNDLRGGYAFVHNQTISADVGKIPVNPWPSGYGFNTGVTNPLYGGMPQIDFSTFTGYLGAGKRTGVRGPEGTVDIVDSVSHLLGKHAFKFGFEYMESVYDNNNYNIANGEVKFSSLTTFLQGKMKSGKILIGNPDLNAREHSFAGFVQDDWRLTTRITLNLGLRYELNQPPTERNNFIGNFNPNVTGNTPAIQQAGPGAPLSSLYHADHRDFSPRVGAAWDVRGNGKTVVRVGASVLNSMLITSELLNPTPFGANFPSIGVNNSNTVINAHSPVMLSGTQALGTWSVAGPVFAGNASTTINGTTYTGITCTFEGESGVAAGTATPCPTAAVNPNFRTPYVAEWNLDIQRAITNSLTFDVAYVGNHGFATGGERDINQPLVGSGYTPAVITACLANSANCTPDTQAELQSAPYFVKFPYISQIGQTGNFDFSNYNALQATVSERASHGLSFIVGYTYSHALDMESSSSISQNPFPLDVHQPRLDYSATSSDIRHRLTFSTTYAIPGMKSPGQMLEGWSTSSILTLQGGTPWGADDTTNDLTGTGEVGASVTGEQTWNFSGPRSAFNSGPHAIPFVKGSVAAVAGSACYNAAVAPYGGPATTNGQLAIAALTNFGCYSQNGGILTPPAFGTVGDATRNLFRGPAYYNVDLSLNKMWKFKERYSAQFRMEFFNLFNRADFPTPTITDPSKSGFGNTTQTPDAANPVLGSGGPRHIQFGLKLTF
jgi:hypothetical protein